MHKIRNIFDEKQEILRKFKKGQTETHISMTIFTSGLVYNFQKSEVLRLILISLSFLFLLLTHNSDFKNKISQMKRLDDATPGMETNGNHLGKIFRIFI